MPDTTLHVFARAPVPGQAKTRLIPALGAAGAAQLHARLVRHTLESALSAKVGPVTLWCAPDDTHPFFAACQREFRIGLQVQQGRDLRQRMSHALQQGLQHSHSAVLIGTDCPALNPAEQRMAAGKMHEGAAAVFVPAADGGYVLIGVSAQVPSIFAGIAWGSNTVMEHTRRHLRSQLIDWCELPALADIDMPQDLQRLQQTHPELLVGLIDLETMS